MTKEQRSIADRFKASYLECDESLKIGISRDFDPLNYPINGLRHLPAGDTTGWYIWSGEYSEASDFFVPIHAGHIDQRCPEIVEYLGLGPGWRFLVGRDQKDVWFDPNLLVK